MLDSMTLRVRMRGLARPGRSQACYARSAGFAALCASRLEHFTDAASIGKALAPRPRAASPRRGTDNLEESSI